MNKAVSLSLEQRRPDSIMDMSQFCHADGCEFASHLSALRFRNSDCLHISVRGTSLSLLFLNIPNFSVRLGLAWCWLGVRVKAVAPN